MEEVQMEVKDKPISSLIYIRCAKAACILYLLKSSSNLPCMTPSNAQDEEKGLMMKKIEDLKMKLARERIKSKTVKLCSLMELILQILAVFSVSTVFFMLAFGIRLI